ncbi:MAG TPA: diguanylate cyclase [Gaiellaceae bacterium]
MRGRIGPLGGLGLGSFRFKLVAWFALLALLPLAVAFYGYDSLARSSETRRADASLESSLRAAVAGYSQQLDVATATARRLAGEQRVQQALATHDRVALAAIAASSPTTRFAGGGVAVGSLPRRAARRTVAILDHGRTIGSVTVAVPVDDRLLAEIGVGLAAGERLVAVEGGRIVAGRPLGARLELSPGAPARVEVGGSAKRGLATPLLDPPGLRLAALTPQRAIDDAARTAEMRLTTVLIVALLVFAVVVFLLGRSVVTTLRQLADAADNIADGRLDERVDVRGNDEFAQLGGAFNRMAGQLQQRMSELRTERRRAHEATTRFGLALGATHDPQQLLQIVAETVVEATGASGAIARTRSGEVLEAGEPTGPEEVAFPLRVGAVDFGSLVVRGSALDADQVETARALVAQAAVALDNARLHRLVEQQALVDVLTGLANRRSLEETLAVELARVGRLDTELCLVLVDLDRFKQVNDRLGHPAGDEVLRSCAQTLAGAVREGDVAGRWGGEEFALILVGVGVAGGIELAERARRLISSRPVSTARGGPVHVTASFGVAACGAGATVDDLIAAADAALYEAKRQGRDRVVGGATIEPVV